MTKEDPEHSKDGVITMGRLVRTSNTDDFFDLVFWQKCSSAERFNAAWDLVAHYLFRKGIPYSEQRLQRTVADLKRL